MRPTNTNEMQGGRCRSATAVRYRARERDSALANLPPMLRTVKWILAEPSIATYVDGLDRSTTAPYIAPRLGCCDAQG
jgi:hypothetical protein